MNDRATVAVQLGRDPRGDVDVVARCPFGLPLVIRTSPRLEDGSPFPTLYYLVCPVAVREIGRLEAAGAMRELEARLDQDAELRDAYARAHERYRAQRDAVVVLDEAASAGGMPSRVKCLHALYAHEHADANPIGAIVRERIEPLDCPGPCVQTAADGTVTATHGHPGFASKKRRR
jgi:uncharacterized protein